jgi:hypothetical protein
MEYVGRVPAPPLDQQYDHSGTGSGLKVSGASAEYVRPMWEAIGTIVIGRNLFDLVNGWEGQPPAGGHVVVVSHRSTGKRYFGSIDGQLLLEDPHVVVQGDRVLHLRFKVRP